MMIFKFLEMNEMISSEDPIKSIDIIKAMEDIKKNLDIPAPDITIFFIKDKKEIIPIKLYGQLALNFCAVYCLPINSILLVSLFKENTKEEVLNQFLDKLDIKKVDKKETMFGTISPSMAINIFVDKQEQLIRAIIDLLMEKLKITEFFNAWFTSSQLGSAKKSYWVTGETLTITNKGKLQKCNSMFKPVNCVIVNKNYSEALSENKYYGRFDLKLDLSRNNNFTLLSKVLFLSRLYENLREKEKE